MAYLSVDQLQKALSEHVFHYAKDRKKASGRALGTLVEIITYYTACAWGLRDSIAIETAVPEFANPGITHNVEFSLHPIKSIFKCEVPSDKLPMTTRKLLKSTDWVVAKEEMVDQQLLSSRRIMRNAATIVKRLDSFVTAHLLDENAGTVVLAELLARPFAIFECKRVGVEEGMKKGPQTIEKAKQGAYVARVVSALQKFRLLDGSVAGVLDLGEGKLLTDDYEKLVGKIVGGNHAHFLRDFILTIGVVSNHGNWFTAENQNKEMRVLAQSYDWLLFLTDKGLSQFINKLLLNPAKQLVPARDAFLASYNAKKAGNQFTKVRIHVEADRALKHYFEQHADEVESWYNVISPAKGTLGQLRAQLLRLADKDWRKIRSQ